MEKIRDGFKIMIIILLTLIVVATYYITFTEIQNNQNNQLKIEMLSKQLEINTKATRNISKKIEKMNLIFQVASEKEVEQEEKETDEIISDNTEKPKLQEKDKKIAIEEDMRVIEKFKNAIQNETEIKSAELVNITGTKILLPINQKARNKNGKDYMKNILNKMKIQYSFTDYTIHIMWKDGTEDTI